MRLSQYESQKKPKVENHRVFQRFFVSHDNEPTAKIQLQAKKKKLLYKKREKEK